jgi:hypothetical protein
LRIEGNIAKNGEIYVPVLLTIQELGIAYKMTLLLDTGAASTIISEGDAAAMDLDLSQLEKGKPALGIGGTADVYILRNANLSFISGDWLIMKSMDQLEVMKHDVKDPIISKALRSLPSLLGRDILGRKFTISSDGNNVTIDL